MKSVLTTAFLIFFLLQISQGYTQDFSAVKELITSGKEDNALAVLKKVEDKGRNLFYF